jgi:hypothetical protein
LKFDPSRRLGSRAGLDLWLTAFKIALILSEGHMESFFDPISKKPITQIQVLEGETKILGIRKFNLGPPPEVIVKCLDPAIAYWCQVCKLNKKKEAYIDHFDLIEVSQDTKPLELANTFYFQICGTSAGTTTLTATFLNKPNNADPYAVSLPISVKPNSKILRFVREPSSPKSSNTRPPLSFDDLWSVHPYNRSSKYEFDSEQCSAVPHMGCMIRFCTTLNRAGVSLKGLHGHHCPLKDPSHAHHFTYAYDFETWKGVGDAYVWEATPFQPEPMPGIAAFTFVAGKKGVILFWNMYQDKKYGSVGHIDLWNMNKMGNDLFGQHFDRGFIPIRDESAFARAAKIVFWPLPAFIV